MASYTRSEDEVVTAQDQGTPDPWPVWMPRKIYIKHLNKMIQPPGMQPFSPSIGIQYRDWSNSRTSGLDAPTGPTDGSTPIFRNGKVTGVLAEVFADWTSAPKGMIAKHMNNAELEVWEDYLGSTRKLTSNQVIQYTMHTDQPWATWVVHRAGLTAADAAGPTWDDNGVLATDFKSILIRPVFTAGTNPTVDIDVWAREATNPRGTWVVVGSSTGLSMQATVQTDYREIWVEVTAVAGSPTSFDIEVSGTGL